MGNIFTFKNEEEFILSEVPEQNKRSFFGGPRGLGDPDDKYLKRRERLIGLPAKRREIIYEEYCPDIYLAYVKCRKTYLFTKKFRCRDHNLARKQCLKQFWEVPGLEQQAHDQYLLERTHFRQTGVSKIETSSKPPPTWEQYQEDMKKPTRQLLKERFDEIFGFNKPKISVEVHNERFNDPS